MIANSIQRNKLCSLSIQTQEISGYFAEWTYKPFLSLISANKFYRISNNIAFLKNVRQNIWEKIQIFNLAVLNHSNPARINHQIETS